MSPILHAIGRLPIKVLHTGMPDGFSMNRTGNPSGVDVAALHNGFGDGDPCVKGERPPSREAPQAKCKRPNQE